MGYWGISDLKNHTRKIDKIHKDFELYQVFMHNFLRQMSGYSHYLEFLKHFGLKKTYKKNRQNL